MKYKVIDSHIHFWDLKNGYNDWVKDTKLPSLVTPAKLAADGFVHIEAHSDRQDPLCEYNWLKTNFPDNNIKIIALVDFTQEIDIFRKDIIKLSRVNYIVGVRQIMAQTTKTSYSPFNGDIPSDLKDKLLILKENNLVFEAQMYPEQYLPFLEDIESSGVTMVVEHLGLPVFAGNNNLAEWKTFLRQVSQNNNWYLKLSGFDMNNDMKDVYKCLDFVFENVSTNQLCYGSNFPISHQDNYNNWKNLLVEYIDSNDIVKDIFFNTPHRIYFKRSCK